MRPDRCKNPAWFYSLSTRLAHLQSHHAAVVQGHVCVQPLGLPQNLFVPDRVLCVPNKKTKQKKNQDYLDWWTFQSILDILNYDIDFKLFETFEGLYAAT